MAAVSEAPWANESSAAAAAAAKSLGLPQLDTTATAPGVHEIEGDVACLLAFKRPAWKTACFHLLGICSLGIVYLVAFWSHMFKLRLTHTNCGLADADAVFVELNDKRSAICQVQRILPPGAPPSAEHRFFEFHKVRFLWYSDQHAFRAVPDVPPLLPRMALDAAAAVGEAAAQLSGASAHLHGPACCAESVRTLHALQYGQNVLLVDAPSLVRIFLHDALQPFYVFQYFSVILWAFEDYYLYSGIVLVITMASIIANVWSQYTERKRMSQMAYFVADVQALVANTNRSGRTSVMRLPLSSADLVPGDVIVVAPGKVSCDMLLLSGECVVDETVLTGECVPVRKAAYSPDVDGGSYHPDTLPQVTMFSGTTVLSARGAGVGRSALAMVVRTGFNTSKGRLLRSILFPKQHDLQFVRQALYFIAMMLCVSFLFYMVDVAFMVQFGASSLDMFVKFLDMITVAVPPALACCLAIAITISVYRLTQAQIHVLDNERVTAAGLLNQMCFDKTGTLTEIGLELSSVVPSAHGVFLPELPQPSAALPPMVRLLFAACHGLTNLDAKGVHGSLATAASSPRTSDGALVVGDPLDQRLFEAAGFDMTFVEVAAAAALPQAHAAAGAPGGAPAAPSGLQLQVSPKRAWHAPMPPPPRTTDALPHGADIEMTMLPHPAAGLDARLDNPFTFSSAASEAQMPGSCGIHLLPGAAVSVLRRFDFSSERMRSACVVALPAAPGAPRRLLLLVKGSPEKLHDFCDPASFPDMYAHLLRSYTGAGLRVLAMACKELGVDGGDIVSGAASDGAGAAASWQRMSQDELEAGASFLGLVLMVNRLKPDSAATIAHLHRGGIGTAMVTGDHVRTGVTVARQCGILAADAPTVVLDVTTGASLEASVLTFHRLSAAAADLGAAGALPASNSSFAAVGAGALHGNGDGYAKAADGANGVAPFAFGRAADAEAAEARLLDNPWAIDEGDNPFAVDATDARMAAGMGSAALGFGAGAGTGAAGTCASGGDVALSAADAMRCVAEGSAQMACTGRAFAKLLAAQRAHVLATAGAMLLATSEGSGRGRTPASDVPLDLFQLVLSNCKVYARMSPDDKRDLVELLGPGIQCGGDDCNGPGAAGGGGGTKAIARAVAEVAAPPEPTLRGLGHHVGFCGDGANDLGALKSALVGVSLCDAEASIAAPLTSTHPSVRCVVDVVSEGRCALVTSLVIFKYTMVYAFVQVLALALLYSLGLIVGNYQYLLQDMFHTTLLASLMGLTRPAASLAPQRPPSQVLSSAVILPVVGQLLVMMLFQVLALEALRSQPSFVPFDPNSNPALDVPTSERQVETGVLFIITCWQLIIAALTFNLNLGGGQPFRRPLWTNHWLLAAMVSLCVFNLYVLWAPEDPFKAAVPAVVELPLALRAELFVLVLVNTAASLLVDAAANATFRSAHLWGGCRAWLAGLVGRPRPTASPPVAPAAAQEGTRLLSGVPVSSSSMQ